MSEEKKRRMINRRQFLRNAALGGAGLAAMAAMGPRTASAAADELRILFAGGTWQTWFNDTFGKPFEESANVKLIWKMGLGFEPLVIAQRKRPQWDLIHQNQNTSSQLGALDAVVEWTEDNIPNLKHVHEAFRYPYLAGKIHTPYGLAVNTKRITKPVTKWADLWDPEFAGKVAFPAWGWMGQEVFHAINQLNGGTPDNIDPGIEKLKALYKTNNASTTNNVEHTHQVLLSEDVWICPHFGARVEKAAEAGAPVEFIIPEEGGLSFIFNTSVINNRPPESMELAYRFVNTTLEPETQIEFSRLTGYPPTNVQAMNNLPPDLKKLEMSEAEVAAFGKIQREFDYLAMFAYRDQIKERWDKEVIGDG